LSGVRLLRVQHTGRNPCVEIRDLRSEFPCNAEHQCREWG
jgi:hypothetical protein